ncbi:hypothetical protein, partial [Pseudomonas sp. GV085]|uniref:hypothetical protein n=1 Tax=Pseudomonas sp. GV085 TaxID=2135756 RepID=UPI001C46637B
LGTQGAQAGHAVGDGWIIFRAKTMGYFLFDKSCRRLRSFLPFALPSVTRHVQSDNVRLSIAAGMLGPQLHGRLL